MATNEQELFRVIGFDYTGRGLSGEDSYIETPEQARGEIEDLKRLAELFRSDPNMTLEDFFRCALETRNLLSRPLASKCYRCISSRYIRRLPF